MHGVRPRAARGPVADSRSAKRRRMHVATDAVQLAPAVGVRPFRAGARSGQQDFLRRIPALQYRTVWRECPADYLAVAGFLMSDLSITVEDNQLVVRGKQTDDAQRVYLHRGIAARQFQRSFVLAEGIEVSGAWLDNGLLHVDLVRPEVETRVRIVEIQSGSTGAKHAPIGSNS